jgi:transposase
MTRPESVPQAIWDTLTPEAQACFATVIGRLEQRIADLEARLNQNSTNSSRPPSTDPPGLKRKPPAPTGRRRRGGQPGHRKSERAMVPPEKLASVTPCKPPACRRCHRPLEGDDPDPLVHQVAEWPVVEPVVHEYRRHRLRCPGCGETTCGVLPPGVPAGAFGPRLQATLSLLAGAYRLSKRQVQQLAKDMIGLRIAVGMIAKLERRSAATLEDPVEELRGSVVEAPVVHIDETSWRQDRKKAWLWVTATARATVFTIAETRAAEVARRLLGTERPQVVISDRFPGYDWIAVGDRQVCWAHLRRDFQAMIDRGGVSEPIGRDLLAASSRLFRWWHRVRDGTMERSVLVRLVGRLKGKVVSALARGERCGCGRTEGTCTELRKVEPAFWTFVRVPGVEPTNNTAERALRHAVIWRRVSGGTDSRAGSRFVERMLSAVATCRQHGRDVLDYLTSCFAARLSGKEIPSLLLPE